MRKLMERLRYERRQRRYAKTWVRQCDGVDRILRRLVNEARKEVQRA
ncbi:MAG: hypothetical protein K6T83_21540 [Alicyclobacillus sp.]|nr:hypothetical protein [Alicyclobacillus sp.]